MTKRKVDPKTGIGNWIPKDIVEEAEWIVNRLCLEERPNVQSIKSVIRVALHHRQKTKWKPIVYAEPGKRYVLYFPKEGGRNGNVAMTRIDTHPVGYPRQPTHFMEIPEDPED